MGSGSFSRAAYSTFSASTVGKATDEIYTSRGKKDIGLLDPKDVVVRESRDSAEHPESSPLIVGIDVTGSMGMLADTIARQGLGVLFEGIFDRKPISDPQVMFMAIGDANCDRAPLQVSQFESDNRVVEQLTQIWIEHGGGGNQFESYNLPWYFAAYHTVHDSMEKRGKRGYLFTIGDEEVPQDLTVEQITEVLGGQPKNPVDTATVLKDAQRFYDVFHIIVGEGSHAQRAPDRVRQGWNDLLGQRAIWLDDHTKLAETIVSAIEVAEGVDAATSAGRWGDGSAAILDAVKGIKQSKPVGLLETGT